MKAALKGLSSSWRALSPLAIGLAMAMKNGLDLHFTQRRPWLPALCLVVLLEVDGMLSSALVDWRVIQSPEATVVIYVLVQASTENSQENSQW